MFRIGFIEKAMEKPAKEYYEMYLKFLNYFSPAKLRVLLSLFILGLGGLFKVSKSVRRWALTLTKFIAFLSSLLLIVGTWGLLKLK